MPQFNLTVAIDTDANMAKIEGAYDPSITLWVVLEACLVAINAEAKYRELTPEQTVAYCQRYLGQHATKYKTRRVSVIPPQ